jgi:phospholipase/carboxylesterase
MTHAALSGPSLAPASGGAARHLVVLLHGLGADGDDLIGLADHWAPLLPETEFVAPHGAEPCDMAPMGRQWFSLRDRSPDAVLAGARRAAQVLDGFLDHELARLDLADDRLALVGFSQGTMMALFAGLRRARAPAAIVGYSGALVGAGVLADELSVKPPLLLVHGDRDEVVPIAAFHDALPALGAVGLTVEWHVCQGLGHGIDASGLELGDRFLVRHLVNERAPVASS